MAPSSAQTTEMPETRVEDKKTSSKQEVIEDEDKNTAQPELSLMRLKGVLINRMGGPLSPTHTVVQGFSGNRLGLTWDDFSLADPAGDFVDLASLPFFVGRSADEDANQGGILGGEIGVKSLHLKGNRWRLQLFSGSQETQRLALSWAQQPSAHLRSLTALQVAKTKGDFEFSPKGTGAEQPLETRGNNDQERQTLLQKNLLSRTRI